MAPTVEFRSFLQGIGLKYVTNPFKTMIHYEHFWQYDIKFLFGLPLPI